MARSRSKQPGLRASYASDAGTRYSVGVAQLPVAWVPQEGGLPTMESSRPATRLGKSSGHAAAARETAGRLVHPKPCALARCCLSAIQRCDEVRASSEPPSSALGPSSVASAAL